MAKSRSELVAAHESFQAEVKSEVDHAQEEVMRIVRNALIAGSLAFVANLLQRAFFSDEDKKKKKFKELSSDTDFLKSELTEKAVLELLRVASNRLTEFLEKVDADE
jgi:hypothetical protein